MSRKFLVTIILILFILPFVSWYYLQRGLDWRKEAQKIMNGTDPFPEGRWEEPGGKTFSDTHLEDHVSLITFMPCDQSEEVIATLNKFYDQFKDTKKKPTSSSSIRVLRSQPLTGRNRAGMSSPVQIQ